MFLYAHTILIPFCVYLAFLASSVKAERGLPGPKGTSDIVFTEHTLQQTEFITSTEI